MMWGKDTKINFIPEHLFWLVEEPYPAWVHSQKDRLKLEFKESGFRQFVDINSPFLITDAMLMFGLEASNLYQKIIEALNPLRLSIRVAPGSFLAMSQHFLGAPFEVEKDEVMVYYLNEARSLLESGGFKFDVCISLFNPYIQSLIEENLERISYLNYRILS